MSVRLHAAFAAAVLALGCADATGGSPPAPPAPPAPAPPSPPPASAPAPAVPPPVRPHLDGLAFPEKVLALTWDDGPDAHTFELAQYLAAENVSATFFVVAAWSPVVSDDPGTGTGVYATGFSAIPVLEDLVALGHRLANHTLNHRLLNYADAPNVVYQLRENQALLDPLITNEWRLFRAPGGGWNADASHAVDGDPTTAPLIGPVRWDIDGKDWEKTLYCRSDRPAVECERAPRVAASRVKTRYIADRYVELADRVGRGIVLFHDRLGHVGSRISLDLARMVIPELKARGFVFAAPVLRFSPLALRSPDSPGDFVAAQAIELADVDGDGKADVCAPTAAGRRCALATLRASAHAYPEAELLPAVRWDAPAAPARLPVGSLRADVDGDGIDDACARAEGGVSCRLSGAAGAAAALFPVDAFGPDPVIRFGDLNGDGKADVCALGLASPGAPGVGLACAFSTGRSFTRPTTWITPEALAAAGWGRAPFAATVQLGDINGDRRADVCGLSPEGVRCGLAP